MLDLIPLFSKPICLAQIERSQLDFSSTMWARNYNNFISETQNILEIPDFLILKNQLQVILEQYFHEIMAVSKNIEIYITESWLNKTEKGQNHHRHWHPNSVLSGIVYLEGDETTGFTRFITGSYEMLEFNVTSANLYNSKSWSIAPVNGRVVIFPSNVEHFVETYEGDIPRISLSFNTFVRGIVNNLALTKLEIK